MYLGACVLNEMEVHSMALVMGTVCGYSERKHKHIIDLRSQKVLPKQPSFSQYIQNGEKGIWATSGWMNCSDKPPHKADTQVD